MSIKYTHTNIVSSNWEKLSSFYINVFECTPVPPQRDLGGDWLSKGTGVKNAHLKGVHLKLPGFEEGGPTLEIYEYREPEHTIPAVANRIGFGHIAFHVNDVEDIHDRVISNGGKTLGEITKKEISGVGFLTFVYMKDPEGNIIEIQNWQKI